MALDNTTTPSVATGWLAAAIAASSLIGFAHGSISEGLAGGFGGGLSGLFAGCWAGIGFNEAAKLNQGSKCAGLGLVGGFILGVPLGADFSLLVDPIEIAITALLAGLAAAYGAGSTYLRMSKK